MGLTALDNYYPKNLFTVAKKIFAVISMYTV